MSYPMLTFHVLIICFNNLLIYFHFRTHSLYLQLMRANVKVDDYFSGHYSTIDVQIRHRLVAKLPENCSATIFHNIQNSIDYIIFQYVDLLPTSLETSRCRLFKMSLPKCNTFLQYICGANKNWNKKISHTNWDRGSDQFCSLVFGSENLGLK